MSKKMEIERSLGAVIKTSYEVEIVNWHARHNLEQMIRVSESLYMRQVHDIVSNVIADDRNILLIAGPSASGKTTSARKIREECVRRGRRAVVVSLDDFFLDRDKTPLLPNGSPDLENVTALDLPRLSAFIDDLIFRGAAMCPHYDFASGKSNIGEKILYEQGDVIIFEGIHALNPQLINGSAGRCYRVYIAAAANYVLGRRIVLRSRILRLMRRCYRDMHERGINVTQTISTWDDVVRGEDRYIKPYKLLADYLFDTSYMFEPLVYDECLRPLLLPLAGNAYADEMLELFSLVGSIKPEAVPRDSLLREFLGNNNK